MRDDMGHWALTALIGSKPVYVSFWRPLPFRMLAAATLVVRYGIVFDCTWDLYQRRWASEWRIIQEFAACNSLRNSGSPSGRTKRAEDA